MAEPMLSAIRKIYNTAMKQDDDIKAMFLTSIMCSRRFGEILDIEYEDIIDGVVHVRADTTKSYKKLNTQQIVEKYPLPQEVLKIIGNGKGKVFNQSSRVYMDKYAEMIDTEVNLKLRPLAKDYPIRSHSNRNFIISIQSKKYGKDYVGSVCLSHATKGKSDINDRYLSFEIEDIKEVFEDYWEKLRGNID